MDSVIISQVENKHGDLTNIDTYRATMVSNVIMLDFWEHIAQYFH